jgi:hypothetical protein
MLETHCESIVTDKGQKSFYGLMSTIKTNYLLADIRKYASWGKLLTLAEVFKKSSV